MIKAALIGCGRIGFLLEDDPLRNKPCTHFGGMRASGIKPGWACDINPDRLTLFGKRSSIKKENLFTDYHALLADNTIQLVTIASWTPTHAPITITAAESGVKVIICEKPIATDIDDARKMIDACRANGSMLIVNHERRYDPRYNAVKKLIRNGAIGKILSVRGSLPTRGFGNNQNLSLGGGPLLHDGTHLIDIISFFCGKYVSVTGRFSRSPGSQGFEDHAWGLMETGEKIPCFFDVGGPSGYFGFSVEIFGESGKIEIGNGFQRLFKASPSHLYSGFFDLSEKKFPKTRGNCFSNIYREAKEILNGTLDQTRSSGADGLAALEVIHGTYLSAFIQKTVKLPLRKRINLKKIFAQTR
jgi:predicted dehydrogenase